MASLVLYYFIKIYAYNKSIVIIFYMQNGFMFKVVYILCYINKLWINALRLVTTKRSKPCHKSIKCCLSDGFKIARDQICDPLQRTLMSISQIRNVIKAF